MAAADPQPFFLTPPPRHLAELRIDTAPSAVAFSAPCAAAKGAGRKRRCLVPGSSVRKRMLLELAPFEVAPSPSSTPPPRPSPPPSPMASLLARTPLSPAPSAAPPPSPAPSSTPPPSPSPPPSPMASRAGAAPSPAREFSFGTVLRVVPPASPGNIFKFIGNAVTTPAGSEASSASSSFLTPLGQAPKPATGVFSFLAAPMATGPTANGGFVFAAPSEGPLTPTSTNTSGGLSFLASPKQPLTPMGSTASGGGGFAASFGKATVVPLVSLKPARTGPNDTGDFAFPSPGPACSQIGTESMPLAALATPPSAVRTSQPPPPPLPSSGDGSHKRPSLFLRRAATSEHRKALRQLEEQLQSTLPPQKIAKTNSLAAGEAFSSSIVSGSSASPCCTFFTSPSKKAAKQEAKKASSEASQSPAGSHCSSPATPEKANEQEQEVEVSSSPRERGPASPRECAPTSPAVVCSGAEMVVRVTCKCGVHKEFCFDHRL